MFSTIRFRKGDPVKGFSLTGQKITGNFVRALPSFGVIVLGTFENSTDPPHEIKCSRLSLSHINTGPKVRSPAKIHQFNCGDSCIGQTPEGHYIIGKYQNAGPKPFAYIRGVISRNGLASPFESVESYKVLRDSLKKQS